MPLKHFHLRLSKEHLAEDEVRVNEFMHTVKVTNTAAQIVTVGSTSYWSIIVFYEEEKKTSDKNADSQEVKESVPLTSAEQERYDALKNWRRAKALDTSFPDYIIAHNHELIDIARLNCTSKEELLQVKGFSEKKLEKYGNDITDVLMSIG